VKAAKPNVVQVAGFRGVRRFGSILWVVKSSLSRVSDSLLFILLLELRKHAGPLWKLSDVVVDETASVGPIEEMISGRIVPKPLVIQYIMIAYSFVRFGISPLPFEQVSSSRRRGRSSMKR
jgi:hypothetical protein